MVCYFVPGVPIPLVRLAVGMSSEVLVSILAFMRNFMSALETKGQRERLSQKHRGAKKPT